MPAVGAADGEAALLESLEGDTETSVVDAQALAQDGPGERLAGAAESGADRLGERERRGVSAAPATWRTAAPAGHPRSTGASTSATTE